MAGKKKTAAEMEAHYKRQLEKLEIKKRIEADKKKLKSMR